METISTNGGSTLLHLISWESNSLTDRTVQIMSKSSALIRAVA